MKTKDHGIESGKMIRLKCSDFMGEYTVEGMFIDYKIPIKISKKYKLKNRFCTLNEKGEWESNSKEWRQRDSWEYIK